MLKKFAAAILLSLAIFSCNEDGDESTVKRTNDDYAPNTIGSTWTYNYPIPDFEFTVTSSIVNEVKVIDGKTYYALKSESLQSSGSSISYARKDGANYIMREPLDGLFENKEQIYLKDGPVGTKWTLRMYPDTENENIFEFEIIEVNGTYTVNGLEFTNVMVVKNTNITDPEEVEPLFTVGYYAKGVGLIKSEDWQGETLQEIVSFTVQ